MGSSRSRHGTACRPSVFFLDASRWDFRGVVSNSIRRAKAGGKRESEGPLESRLERFTRLDAVYGVWILWLCHREFPAFYGQGSKWRQRWKSASGSLERLFRTLDGLLLRCARRFIFRCSHGGHGPTLCEWAFGIAQRDLLQPLRSTRNANPLESGMERNGYIVPKH